MQNIVVYCLFVFIGNINAVIFNCNFYIEFGGYVGDVYTCKPEVTNSNQLHVLEAVKGTHLEGRENQNVEALYVLAQTLHYLPNNLGNFFPNLRAIWCHESQLLKISAETLKPFPNLMEFGARNNALETLDGDLFKYTPKLKWIYFSSNLIQHVGYDLMTDLIDLQNAIFLKNPCINVTANGFLEIQELNMQLPRKCRCAVKCSLGNDVQELQNKIDVLEELNIQQRTKQSKLDAETEERLLELEKQIRELNSNPQFP